MYWYGFLKVTPFIRVTSFTKVTPFIRVTHFYQVMPLIKWRLLTEVTQGTDVMHFMDCTGCLFLYQS